MTAPPARRRALLRAATSPLARAALTAVAALACAGPAPTPGTPGLSRVVLAPLNLGLRTPDELQGSKGAVWNELLSYLHAQDARVRIVADEDARVLWQEAVADVERSGAELEPQAVGARFAVRLREQVDYDVLVMPSLVLRSARIGGRYVSWDGRRRKLPLRPRVPADLAYASFDYPGYRGSLAAASLYVALFGPDGRSLFEGLAGLDVVQEIARGRRERGEEPWQVVARDDAFSDAASLRAGVERAFERRLPRTARSR